MRKILIGLAVLFAPHAAHACGVPDLPRLISDAVEALSTHPEPIHTPDVLIGGWPDGSFTLAAGYAWGHKDVGFLGGSDVSRVLLAMHTENDHRSLALTYGRFGSMDPWGVAADLGVSAAANGVGPTGSVQLGLAGFSLRLTGTVPLDPDPHVEGRAEVMFDLENAVGAI
jgi:hypothetical protein